MCRLTRLGSSYNLYKKMERLKPSGKNLFLTSEKHLCKFRQPVFPAPSVLAAVRHFPFPYPSPSAEFPPVFEPQPVPGPTQPRTFIAPEPPPRPPSTRRSSADFSAASMSLDDFMRVSVQPGPTVLQHLGPAALQRAFEKCNTTGLPRVRFDLTCSLLAA